ncbi:rod shape-determining protein MreC [Saccharospirillum mangrovi]|uniref:rod shape-determining protein MreC n=1 Tax=Saccharospirillum mangrovi TaxID=2161747 RepID=UPI000D341DFD|nr:rod shape-determining protein MreC [Saccharospirillum mangrovi]
MSALFTAGPQHGYRLLVAVVFAIALMTLDARFTQLDYVRQALSYLVSPVQQLIRMPTDMVQWSSRTFAERDELLDDNQSLRSQVLILQQKVQQLAVLQAENQRLRSLLGATERFEASYLTAEMISIDPDPFTHQVIINRGAQDGVYIGQAVLDATGLFGQVIQVDSLSSRVLLVADANHAVPVQVNRNGMRSILVGTGDLTTLELEFVPETADIQVGDLLMTSGLASRFPEGYPVAEVQAVEHNPGEPFAQIRARPLAALARSRNLLLVFKDGEAGR